MVSARGNLTISLKRMFPFCCRLVVGLLAASDFFFNLRSGFKDAMHILHNLVFLLYMFILIVGLMSWGNGFNYMFCYAFMPSIDSHPCYSLVKARQLVCNLVTSIGKVLLRGKYWNSR